MCETSLGSFWGAVLMCYFLLLLLLSRPILVRFNSLQLDLFQATTPPLPPFLFVSCFRWDYAGRGGGLGDQ